MIVLFAGILPASLSAQSVDQANYDKFYIAWASTTRTIAADGSNVVTAYNAVRAFRARFTGADQTLYDQFIISWASSSRSIDADGANVVTAFNAIRAFRARF